MADSKHYLVETTLSHSEEGSISETYVEVKMEDVGGYSVHVDSPEKEKEKIRPTMTTGTFVHLLLNHSPLTRDSRISISY
jgi:hypothetical protein